MARLKVFTAGDRRRKEGQEGHIDIDIAIEITTARAQTDKTHTLSLSPCSPLFLAVLLLFWLSFFVLCFVL